MYLWPSSAIGWLHGFRNFYYTKSYRKIKGGRAKISISDILAHKFSRYVAQSLRFNKYKYHKAKHPAITWDTMTAKSWLLSGISITFVVWLCCFHIVFLFVCSGCWLLSLPVGSRLGSNLNLQTSYWRFIVEMKMRAN